MLTKLEYFRNKKRTGLFFHLVRLEQIIVSKGLSNYLVLDILKTDHDHKLLMSPGMVTNDVMYCGRSVGLGTVGSH